MQPLPGFAAAGGFRADIEGLRAVAIALVIACHCQLPGCAGGFVGVDVFFVLSGYLMTGLLSAERRASGGIALARFYARRARRLVPAATLALLATLALSAALLAPLALEATGRAAAAAALYLSNVYFDRAAADYFAPDVAANPLLHTWSLGVEEQFYLLWPLLLLVAGRGTRPRAILSIVALGSFVFGLLATRRVPTFAFYELPARAWEFAAGGLLALLPSGALGGTRLAPALGVAGLVIVLACGVWMPGGAGFPGVLALGPVAGTLLVLNAGALAPGRGAARLLAAAPLQYLGARSYSWYLLHWPAVVFAAVLVPGVGAAGRLLAAALALAGAAVSYRFVERPVRHSAYLGARPALSLVLAAGATLLSLAAAWALLAYGQRLAAGAGLEAVGAATADLGSLSQRECVSQGPASEVRECAFGPEGAATRLVLFGDSHAIEWFDALQGAALARGWRLVTVVKSGCPAGEYELAAGERAHAACQAWRAHALEAITALRPSAIVVGSYAGVTLRGFRGEPALPLAALEQGLRTTLARLAALGVPVVVLRDSPLPPGDIPGCLAQHRLGRLAAGDCDFPAAPALNAAGFAAEQAAARGLPGVRLLDLSDAICKGERCPALVGGRIVYRDDNHLTGAYARSLAPVLGARLAPLLGDGG